MDKESLKQKLLKYQKTELLESGLYEFISKRTKNETDKKILLKLSKDEYRHSEILKEYTNSSPKVNSLKLLCFKFLILVLGYTFIIKKMEKGENEAIKTYEKEGKEIKIFEELRNDEKMHEEALIRMLNEEKLNHIGAMVLGLNDALVELTGVIAGVTFAIHNNKYIALTGIITGIAATLSMSASNYLSKSAEEEPDAIKSSFYTGAAYFAAVILMVLPFLIFPSSFYAQAFVLMIVFVIGIIFIFNYYLSVVRSVSFKKKFFEMLTISSSVAIISFLIGLAAKNILGIDV